MAYETVLIEDAQGVRTITLNRPQALNAFNETLKDELIDALKAAARDKSVRCLVVTGAGRAFCAGQDLKDRSDRADQAGSAGPGSFSASLRDKYNPMIMTIRTMEKPVIAAVNGVAAGAGCSLALACDLRVVADKATFIQAFVKIGLVPDSGATFLLPRLVGMGKALELAFTGDPLDAGTALTLGLANSVVPGEALLTATMDLATRLAQAPTRAIGLTKRAMNRALLVDLESALDYEADMQEIAGRSPDFAEGVSAFMEKRQPRFTGQ
jgi:2-(1,2-epoxy-1,2-dihydrophenyl)acetyl-CoA isomerase